MKYQQGELVVYGLHGICKVLGMESRGTGQKKTEYYVLEPNDQPGSRYYIPAGNQAALSKLRRVLTKDELLTALSADSVRQLPWIADENQRKLRYRELINSGDFAAQLAMVFALERHQIAQHAAGRKFHLCDENFLHDAQKLLYSEFSAVLGIPISDVPAYIQQNQNA